MPWLQSYNPSINWTNKSITFKLEIQRADKAEFYQLLADPTNQIITLGIRDRGLPEVSIKEKVQDGEIPSMLEPLLKEFKDIFPEELPKELLLQRSVDHKIDLILGAEPTWRAIYQLSQPEFKALKQEIQDLLERGAI